MLGTVIKLYNSTTLLGNYVEKVKQLVPNWES